MRFYKWESIDPQLLVSDSLVGKVHREFQAHWLTVFPASKVKSAGQAAASHHEVKKPRIADRLALTLDDEEDNVPLVHFTIIEWLANFKRMTISWAVVGCYAVADPTKDEPDSTTMYAFECELDQYRREFTHRGGYSPKALHEI